MSRFPKFVAAILAVLLIAAPMVAATPCLGVAHSTPDCTKCCDEMSASMRMPAAAAMMGNLQGQLSQLTCCKASSSETANVAISQDPQSLVSTAVDRESISMELPLLAVAPPRRQPSPPDRSKSDRVYSDLCTYRI
jgi:hypothetical protein